MKVIPLIFILSFILINSQKRLTTKQIDSIQATLDITTPENADKIESGSIDLINQSKEINYPKGQMESLMRLSSHYINSRKNLDKADEYLEQIKKIALKNDDYYYYCRAQANKSSLLMLLNFYEQSADILYENEKNIKKVSDPDKRNYLKAYYYGRLVNLYGVQRKKDSVLLYANKMYQASALLPKKESFETNIFLTSVRLLTSIYTDLKQEDKAEYYLNIQEKHINQTQNLYDLATFHKSKAEFIFYLKPHVDTYLDEALKHYKLAEKYMISGNNTTMIESLYSGMSDIYKAKKDIKNQVTYLELSTKAKDSTIRFEKNSYKNIEVETIPKEKPIPPQQQLQNKEKKNNYTIYFFILILISMIILGAVIMFKKIDLNKLKTKKQPSKKIKQKEEEEKKQDVTINEALKNLALSNDSSFFANFQHAYPEFSNKLIAFNPNFTSSDIEFCALVKLGIESKQIAEFRKTTIQAVAAKRGRLRKKIDLQSNECFSDWIKNF